MSTCRVVLDASRCAGIGLCEAAMPEAFSVDDDGHLHLRATEFTEEHRAELEDIVAHCPTQSLSLQIID
ncbi:ferredoxin [Mycobacterium sp. shizuoka-1]|uniref:ferredoxin n=1 Tax=Mycobacterium sp. shizuoka-1 TaxID=2039281 RepID=UPI000C0601CF|nr:ferredoxin [Mycobacterium sp. shizuoka-1]GAY15583.1 hypothetical protein MSZK_23090 [Mycobacterium sp. shizuoka-1]